uniref:HDC01261 n=1 Tax=Drosophila melanogaster TaxID=7227 RepID=Q6IHS4_DROME|nr:TPA_inf: HDC01261 [Drosophila melanogaster]
MVLLLLLLLVLLLVLLLLLFLLLVVLQPCLAVFGGRSDRQMRVRAQPVTNLQHVAYQLIAVTICGHHFINYGDNLSAVIAPWLIGRQVSLDTCQKMTSCFSLLAQIAQSSQVVSEFVRDAPKNPPNWPKGATRCSYYDYD